MTSGYFIPPASFLHDQRIPLHVSVTTNYASFVISSSILPISPQVLTAMDFPPPSGHEALGPCACGDADFYHNHPNEPAAFGPDMNIESSSKVMAMVQRGRTIQWAVLKLDECVQRGGDALLPTVCKSPINGPLKVNQPPKAGQKRSRLDDINDEDIYGVFLPPTPSSPPPLKKRRRRDPKTVVNKRIFFSLPPGSHKIGDTVINIAPKHEEFQPSRMGVMSVG